MRSCLDQWCQKKIKKLPLRKLTSQELAALDNMLFTIGGSHMALTMLYKLNILHYDWIDTNLNKFHQAVFQEVLEIRQN